MGHPARMVRLRDVRLKVPLSVRLDLPLLPEGANENSPG